MMVGSFATARVDCAEGMRAKICEEGLCGYRSGKD